MDIDKERGVMPAPSKDFKLFEFRIHRENMFKIFDIWEKAVLRGRETDDQDVMNWYQEMLDFPEQITELTSYGDYPVLPVALKKYL